MGTCVKGAMKGDYKEDFQIIFFLLVTPFLPSSSSSSSSSSWY